VVVVVVVVVVVIVIVIVPYDRPTTLNDHPT
jgi:hypothetical protein